MGKIGGFQELALGEIVDSYTHQEMLATSTDGSLVLIWTSFGFEDYILTNFWAIG